MGTRAIASAKYLRRDQRQLWHRRDLTSAAPKQHGHHRTERTHRRPAAVHPVVFLPQNAKPAGRITGIAATHIFPPITALTNIANPVSVLNRFNEGFARQRRNISLFGCLMIDVDASIDQRPLQHPKGINVLPGTGRHHQLTLRQYDTFGRYGGEEFLMVLNGVDKGIWPPRGRTRAAVETTLSQQVGSPTRSPSASAARLSPRRPIHRRRDQTRR